MSQSVTVVAILRFSRLSGSLGIRKINRTGMDALKSVKHLNVWTGCNEKTATGTVGLNQLGMIGIGFPQREVLPRLRRLGHEGTIQK